MSDDGTTVSQDAGATPGATTGGTSELLASAGGSLLAALTRVVALRPAAKPLHPRGVVRPGVVVRHGSDRLSGVPWVDDAGEDEVLVRVSRAVGLPARWPDIHGLAVRLPGADGPADLLFASTGWGRAGRFLLVPHRQLRDRPQTTLLPYRTAAGPLLLGVRPLGPEAYVLFWSRATGPWTRFATLRLAGEVEEAEGDDADVSFDPVRHQLPGLDQYPWVVRLREPAYGQARRTRR